MPNRLRRHLSYANVIATSALFIALGGGAYAAATPTPIGRHFADPHVVPFPGDGKKRVEIDIRAPGQRDRHERSPRCVRRGA